MWNWVRGTFFRWMLGSAGVAGCLTGAVFTYKTHYEHPQYRYLPVDQEWRDHLQGILEISRREVAASGPAEILVDVSGAVQKPGVYKISPGGRVQEVILAAGGFIADADKEFIHRDLNLANVVRDKDKIYIPFAGEAVSDRTTGGQGDDSSRKINMNTASQAVLDSLVGIGEQRAIALISNRPYEGLQDLVDRTGISKSVFEKIIQEGYELTY